MRKTIVILLAPIYLFFNNTYAQATYTQGSNANQLATELSVNGGFTISNQVITNGGNRQRGVFSNGANAGLSLTRGIILTSGRVNRSMNNQNTTQGDDDEQASTYDDPDLVAINPNSNNDVVVYEFDFTIAGTEPKIFALDYQFASEEYPDYVCGTVNDIFGFFVSGGDLTGTSNLASAGGDNVAVNSVNNGRAGISSTPGEPCELGNASLFVQNFVFDDAGTPGDTTDDFLDTTTNGPHHIMYNGFTTALRAYTILRPGITYHMKMAIADTQDSVFDSAVFVAPIQIFDLPPKSDIDFDGVDDFVNSAPFFGNETSATMMSWIKLDSGFASRGEVCGQSNFKLFVDGSNRLKTRATTGSDRITYTFDMNDGSPTGANAGWFGYVEILVNGTPVSVNLGGFPTTILSPEWDPTFTFVVPTSVTFTANPGDAITINYYDGFNGPDRNNTTFQLYSGDGTLVHDTPYNSLTGDATYNYTAACAGCPAVVVRQTPNGIAPTLLTDMWYHATTRFDGTTGQVTLFLNGEQVWQASGLASNFHLDDDDFDFAIGYDSENTNRYFRGNIDEVRVYNTALTDTQIREQIYQEVENIGGFVTGSTIPKSIDNNAIPWGNLRLYYDMDLIYDTTLIDASGAAKNGFLNNITSVQTQTAPLPYVANASGAWTNSSTWQNGNVWDVTTLPNRDWAIVNVTNNAAVTTINNHTHLGLLVDSGAELEVNNDSGIFNSSYLRIDGTLDLQGEAQLIQTTTSDLDVLSSGNIEIDQQGRADIYSYNHWSSPVGPITTTQNNGDYTVSQILRDGTVANNPQAITYVTGFNGAPTSPITLSNYWFFTFYDNPDDYNLWQQVFESGTIRAGQGYTMKGPGSGANANTQNYVFTGKPNNGVIQHATSGTNLSLLGNPYPSAIDANQFITDNITVIEEDGDVIGAGITTGALYVWEHFSTNNSHNLYDYEGGYATYNLAGATIAIPDPGVSANGTGSVLLRRYIPVGQGFFVQSEEGGNIEFNNGQRAFQRESDGDSVFTFTGGANTDDSDTATTTPFNELDGIRRLYFRFKTPAGPQRQLLLALKEGRTLEAEAGWDAPLIDSNPSDAYWKIIERTEPFVIQTIGNIVSDLEVPITFKIGESGNSEFALEEVQGITEEQEIFLLDKELNAYYDIRNEGVNLELPEGLYEGRFFIVFEQPILSNDNDIEIPDNLDIYYDVNTSDIVVRSGVEFNLSDAKLYNVLGQEILRDSKEMNQILHARFPVNVSTGTYIFSVNINETKKTLKLMIN